MHKNEIHDIQRKLKVLKYAKEVGNVAKTMVFLEKLTTNGKSATKKMVREV